MIAFYPGLHQPSDTKHFRRACISINRLWQRRKPLGRARIFVDSGAFTILAKHGHYPESHSVERYAQRLYELHTQGIVRIAVASTQDYMCEPMMLAKTGFTVADHQRLTVERYDALVASLARLFGGPPPFPILPVLQGWTVGDYRQHLAMYGGRLSPRMWVGVGSVCKRQGNTGTIEAILRAIKEVRPDLRLHGFWREADGAAEPCSPPPVLDRRQHGVVLRSSEERSQRERLAGSRRLRPAGERSAMRSRAVVAALRMTTSRDHSPSRDATKAEGLGQPDSNGGAQ